MSTQLAITVPLAHGWTSADAERIAGRAARDHYSRALPAADRKDAAWHAVVTVILEAAEPPPLIALLNAGRDAISRAVTAESREREGGRAAAGLARYWHGAPLLISPWEETLIERVALGQVWEILPARHARVLEALASHGTYESAARSLGTSDATFRVRLSKARAAFRAWWHEHEDPPGMWGSDRRGDFARRGTAAGCLRARMRDRAAAA